MINDAIYECPAGLKVIPAGISLQGFQQADPEKIRDVMNEIVKRCDFLLIDAPAGISKDGIVPLAVADEVILVVNPELSSIVDALKTRILTELVGRSRAWFNHQSCRPGQSRNHDKKDGESARGQRLSGLFPKTRTSVVQVLQGLPLVIKFPTSPASKAFRRIASGLIGVAYKDEGENEKREGFIERFTKALFTKKSEK